MNMSFEPPVLSDRWFTSEAVPPEDSVDLERQCHIRSGEIKETLWGRIWRLLLFLVFKTETSAVLSRANGNVSSTSNTRVSSDRPALDREIVTETPLVEPVAIDMDSLDDSTELTQAQSGSQSIPSLESEIRLRSPPLPPTQDPSTLAANDARSSRSTGSSPNTMRSLSNDLRDEELDDLISLIEMASCSPPLAPSTISPARNVDVSQAMQRPRHAQRESRTIPFFPYPFSP